MPLSRRSLLAGACGGMGALAAAALPGVALAALPGDRRLVVMVLRGGMDGLHAVPPLGDPDYAAARGALALGRNGEEGAVDLDGFFALHPALAPLVPLWQRKELAVVHAVATPYRERSHFDGQDVLESGAVRPHGLADGWLNRALAALAAGPHDALAVAQGLPLVLRGAVPATSWAPSPLPGLPPALVDKLARLYEGDRLLAMAFEEGVQAEAFAADALAEDEDGGGDMMAAGRPNNAKGANAFPQLAEAAGRMLAAPGGPRVAVMELGGWDTHTGQRNRMGQPLAALAGGIAGLAKGLGPAWTNTLVVAASEFGRTVAENGTGGTDHGTAGVSFLAGGALAGGRVLGNWPGLARDRLWQERDLAPTTDLRSVLKGVLKDHLRVPATTLAAAVFPDSAGIPAMGGLVRS